MNTPFGTFELKLFWLFAQHRGRRQRLQHSGAGPHQTARRGRRPQKPLSDSQLSTMLEEQGIQVAPAHRGQYREALKIAPANLRKAL